MSALSLTDSDEKVALMKNTTFVVRESAGAYEILLKRRVASAAKPLRVILDY